MVDVEKLLLLVFNDFCGATLCGDPRGRSKKTVDLLRFLRSARDPLRGSCVSKRSRCGVVRIFSAANFKWRRANFSRNTSLPTFHANFKSRLFKYNGSTRSVLPRLRLVNRNFSVQRSTRSTTTAQAELSISRRHAQSNVRRTV